jgi:hypothetical protein
MPSRAAARALVTHGGLQFDIIMFLADSEIEIADSAARFLSRAIPLDRLVPRR